MSTSSQAVRVARGLQEAMGDYGVTCIIQLRQGASRSGWLNPVSNWRGVMAHHIVSSRAHGTTPFYNLVRNGRADVPGPLANGYGGWDKRYRIITMGWANHPGAGGPITLAGRRIPQHNGRPYFWGTEYEGGMRASDWERDDFHGWMATCNAAILDWLGLPTTTHVEHLTWAPGRKIDRLNYTAQSGRNRIAAVRGKTGGTAMSARDVWTYRGTDYVNENNNTQQAKLARAHQYAFEQPERVWGHRDRDFVNENPNSYGFMLARIHQYVWEQRAKIRNIESDLAGLRAAMEAMAAAEGGHVYEAVTNALKDHDERTVKVEVTVTEPEENEA